jgi:hypothetical protein
MAWLEPGPEAVMVPLITMTALSPAFHFPPRYADLILARAARTEARGFETLVPAFESFPPAETYQTEPCGPWESPPNPGSKKTVLPHPAIKTMEKAVTKKIKAEKRDSFFIFLNLSKAVPSNQRLS